VRYLYFINTIHNRNQAIRLSSHFLAFDSFPLFAENMAIVSEDSKSCYPRSYQRILITPRRIPDDSTFPSQLDSSCSTLTRTASQSSLSILEWEQASTSAHYIANNSNNRQFSSLSLSKHVPLLHTQRANTHHLVPRTDQLRSHVGTTTATIDSIARLLRNLLDMDDSQEVVKARMECCRVIGNLCFDHGTVSLPSLST